MSLPRKYMAAPVPGFLRQTKLSHLPLNAVIGSWVAGEGNSSLRFDVIMLPVPQFQRMKNSVGLQHMHAPTLNMGPTFSPSFVLSDVKHVSVPEDEPDPEEFARNYFIREFKLAAPDQSPDETEGSDFSGSAKECTSKISSKSGPGS